jgi:hypothetical protein
MAAGSIHPDSGEPYTVLWGGPLAGAGVCQDAYGQGHGPAGCVTVDDATADEWKTWLLEYADFYEIAVKDFEKRAATDIGLESAARGRVSTPVVPGRKAQRCLASWTGGSPLSAVTGRARPPGGTRQLLQSWMCGGVITCRSRVWGRDELGSTRLKTRMPMSPGAG